MALALASCGGGGSSGAGTAAEASANSTEAKVAAPAAKCVRSSGRYTEESANACAGGGGQGGAQGGGRAKAGGGGGGCQESLGEFVGRMNDLRHSLLAGLSYAEYVVRVRAIRDAYEAVPVQRLGVGCLKGPAADAEAAFNQYLRAANAWGECAGTEGCAASEIEGKLQRRWRIASKSLDAAQRG